MTKGWLFIKGHSVYDCTDIGEELQSINIYSANKWYYVTNTLLAVSHPHKVVDAGLNLLDVEPLDAIFRCVCGRRRK